MTDTAPTGTAAHDDIAVSALNRLQEVEQLVDQLVASWNRAGRPLDARRGHRAAFDRPLAVTPLDDRTGEPRGEAILGTGRDVSVRGISFLHADPLPCRKVAVTFPDEALFPLSVEICLKWCRFTREGVYHSGGRILGLTSLLLPEHVTFQDLLAGNVSAHAAG